MSFTPDTSRDQVIKIIRDIATIIVFFERNLEVGVLSQVKIYGSPTCLLQHGATFRCLFQHRRFKHPYQASAVQGVVYKRIYKYEVGFIQWRMQFTYIVKQNLLTLKAFAWSGRERISIVVRFEHGHRILEAKEDATLFNQM